MSALNPETSIHFATEAEHQQIVGQLFALQMLTAQSWSVFLRCSAPEARDQLVSDSLVALEDNVKNLHPIAQRAALAAAENLLQSALTAVRQMRSEG